MTYNDDVITLCRNALHYTPKKEEQNEVEDETYNKCKVKLNK